MGRPLARRVLITGVGGGLGRAAALAFAKAGSEVLGTVRGEERALRLTADYARDLAGSSGSVTLLPLELSDRASLECFAARATEWSAERGLDLLIQNAGFGLFGPAEEQGESEMERQYAVNLFGPMALTRALLPALRQRRGQLLFLGSLSGRLSLPFQAHYSASKAALAAMSDALRMELRPFGVRVTLVEPGDFATGFVDARRALIAPGSLYESSSRRALTEVERQERGGASPELLGAALVRLSRRRDPPARFPIGRWARTLCLLERLAPERVREWFVRNHYGLTGS